MTVSTAHIDTFVRDRLPPPAERPALINLDRLGYPARLNAAAALLDAAAADAGDRTAVITPRGRIAYRELAAQVNRFAHVLVDDLGLVPGGRVLLRAANSAALLIAWFAVVKAGGIAVTTMPLLRRAELQAIVDKAQIGIALCERGLSDELDAAGPIARRLFLDGDDGDGLERLAAARPGRFDAVDTAAADPCLIAFTSGTTGQPKGAVHAHRDILTICNTFSREVLRPNADDIFIGSPPLAFTFGLGGLALFPLRARAATVLLERAPPAELAAAIERYRASVCFTAPTAYRAMLDSDNDLSSLRRCVAGGEPIARATFDAWRARTGIELIDGMGSTEMLHIFITTPVDAPVRPGATGKPVPLYEAKVIDDEGRTLPPNRVGRLAVRGPTGCQYLDDPRQRGYVRDGWNLTGDAFLVDDDGYFWFQARADDMIISAGYNIAGPEVEAALLSHHAVAECAVVAAPDAERGHIVKAFVVVKTGARADAALATALQTHVKNVLAPYKYPRALEFVDALPRTGTGKIQRYRLRLQEQERYRVETARKD